MPFIGSPFAFAPGTMQSAIERLGLTSGLQICLDAGDLASYAGSGQSWADVSGNSYNFNRGSGSGADGADPTFNGAAGGQSSSEYWSFDGGDYFTLGQANPTWVNDVHKNSGIVTVATWVWINSTTGINGIVGTFTNTANPSWNIGVNANGTLGFATDNGTGTALLLTTSATITEDAWTFLAVSMDEGAGAHFLRINATNENKSATATSPSASNASVTLRIGASGETGDNIESGGRMNSIAVWNRALSGTEVTSLYEATKAKFGL